MRGRQGVGTLLPPLAGHSFPLPFIMYEKYGKILYGKYVKEVTKKHFMNLFNGFGISEQVLDELKELGVQKVVIAYYPAENEREVYAADVDQFVHSAKTYLFNGSDLQRFVSTVDMERLD